MLHKKVKHEIGLAALMGAFALAFFAAGIPAMELNATLVDSYSAYALDQQDADRDGIADDLDAVQNVYYTRENVDAAMHASAK